MNLTRNKEGRNVAKLTAFELRQMTGTLSTLGFLAMASKDAKTAHESLSSLLDGFDGQELLLGESNKDGGENEPA